MITGRFSSIAICASAHQSLVIGTILGVLGSIAGAFAGYEIRHRLVEAFGLPDFGMAVAEDIVAIGSGFLIGCGSSKPSVPRQTLLLSIVWWKFRLDSLFCR